MSAIEVLYYLEELRKDFFIKNPAPELIEEIDELFRQKKYTEAVKRIKNFMEIPNYVKTTMRYTKDPWELQEGKSTGAENNLDVIYGSLSPIPTCVKSIITINKQSLDFITSKEFIFFISHELGHSLLEAKGISPTDDSAAKTLAQEKRTEVLSMMFFNEIIKSNRKSTKTLHSKTMERVLGYLNEKESLTIYHRIKTLDDQTNILQKIASKAWLAQNIF